MRKLLAVALIGGALIVSTSALASNNTSSDQSGVAQTAQLAPYPLPPQPPKPFVSITIPV